MEEYFGPALMLLLTWQAAMTVLVIRYLLQQKVRYERDFKGNVASDIEVRDRHEAEIVRRDDKLERLIRELTDKIDAELLRRDLRLEKMILSLSEKFDQLSEKMAVLWDQKKG